MDLFMAQHVRHAEYVDGRPTVHFDEDGDIAFDENEGDCLNILGIFSSERGALDRIEFAKSEPGFRDEPECFYVAPYTLDEPLLVGGVFVYDVD
jgi:hypothetical protein